MRKQTTNKAQLFTSGERQVAGLAILTAVVVTLSGQVVDAMMRPSLGLYDTHRTTVASVQNVVDAQPLG
ncbi:hypothetical protein [Brevundimonas sp.]|uniref:hypothetical protein n=1 Tax=Brevundimonas sp. TaxID=1871086 RepID=UPI00286B466D|nr:hypothetical protein [Brevundimonas sp.]